jgi:catechol 2,3-dioxygenase-like lactoylglutathione lyase family enzyme
MELGAFSISLAVNDLAASRSFYEKLGFEVKGGDADEGWQILANGTTVIGLFQGMFERNILTFNPGVSQDMEMSQPITDVREIQEALEAAGLEIKDRVDPSSQGPGHITLEDPDGNPILIDQFM